MLAGCAVLPVACRQIRSSVVLDANSAQPLIPAASGQKISLIVIEYSCASAGTWNTRISLGGLYCVCPFASVADAQICTYIVVPPGIWPVPPGVQARLPFFTSGVPQAGMNSLTGRQPLTIAEVSRMPSP